MKVGMISLVLVALMVVSPLMALAEEPEEESPLFGILIVEGMKTPFNPPEYSVGDKVNFTLYVYFLDHRVDPGYINVTYISGLHSGTVPVSRISTGTYTGSIQTNESFSDETVLIIATFGYGGLNGSAQSYFYVSGPSVEELDIMLESPISDMDYVSPGDSVPVTVRAYRGEEPVDIDLENLTLSLESHPYPFPDTTSSIKLNVTFTRVEKGKYTTAVQIPQNLSQYGDMEIRMEYVEGDTHYYDGHTIVVGVFSVWVKFVSKGSSNAEFEVRVYTADGEPISGASVAVKDCAHPSRTGEGTTDESGKATITVNGDFTGDEYREMDMKVKVSYGGLTQYMEVYHVWEPEEMEVPEGDFYAIPTNLPTILGMPYVIKGVETEIVYKAYYMGSPLANSLVVWYITNGDDVFSGNSSTDGSGTFTVNYTFPEEGTYFLVFRAPVESLGGDEYAWDTGLGMLLSFGRDPNITIEEILSDKVEITTSELYPGYPLEVQFTYRGDYLSISEVVFEMFLGGLDPTEATFAQMMQNIKPTPWECGYPGEAHVTHEENSSSASISITMPPLSDVGNLSLLCGFFVTEKGVRPVDLDHIDDFVYFVMHITDYVKVNLITLTWKEPVGTVLGKVSDNETKEPIVGAQVSVGDETVYTNREGEYNVTLPPGAYNVTIRAEGYIPVETTVDVPLGGEVYLNISMTPLPEEWGNLTVQVENKSGGRVVDALVKVTPGNLSGRTDENGKVGWTYLPLGNYTISVSAAGYKSYEVTLSLKPGITTVFRVVLEELPTYNWGHLRVSVVDSNGSPLPNATVSISSEGANYTAQMTTGGDGTALFSYIPVGTYNISVSADGYFPTNTSATVVVNETTEITITLERIPPPAPAYRSYIYGGGEKKSGEKYIFEVYYNDTGGRPPQGVYVVVDGKRYNMTGEGGNYTEGVRFFIELELDEGEHTYYFTAIGPDGKEVPAYDDTPTTSGEAKKIKVEKEEKGIPLTVILLLLVVIIIVIGVLYFVLSRGKGPVEEE
ncbi:MAG: carboxypeptidase regulatory-like domain-containing protein [Thermoplasmata archaeon]|nr:carboxypeptidase regulatory-like domain-containing protein [Thermoplasmata archaeon]